MTVVVRTEGLGKRYGNAVGFAGWAGTAMQGTALPIGRALGAGANLVPAALLVLGTGLLLFGAALRATAAVAYGLVAWSFVIQFVASLLDAPRRLLDLSVLRHVALAPAIDPKLGQRRGHGGGRAGRGRRRRRCVRTAGRHARVTTTLVDIAGRG